MGFLFAHIGLVVGIGDVNGDGKTQFHGNLIMAEHPTVTLPPQAGDLSLDYGTQQAAKELFRFNDYGQPIYSKDAELNVSTHEYYGTTDPLGRLGIDPNGGGYIAAITRDTEEEPGRNSGYTISGPVAQRTELYYDADWDHINDCFYPPNARGIATTVVDPRGVKSLSYVNEVNQLVRISTAVSSNTGIRAFGYLVEYQYDDNENLVSKLTHKKHPLFGDQGVIQDLYEYDILDNLRWEVLAYGNSGEIDNTFEYDASNNQTRHTRGIGNPEAATEAWVYDARNILMSYTRDEGVTDAIVTTEVDLNGSITARVDATGDREEFTFDGYNRQIRFEDREDNYETTSYDSNGNILAVERWGPADPAVGTVIKLAKTDRSYDERERPYRNDRWIDHYPGREVGFIDDGDLEPRNDNEVSAIRIYDRRSRIIGGVTSEAELFRFHYDGLSRQVYRADAVGNVVVQDFDKNGNLTRVWEIDVHEKGWVDAESFVTNMHYDAVNRLVKTEEPNGQLTRRAYDSRGNLIVTVDAMLNIVGYDYDDHSRLTRLFKNLSYVAADRDSGTRGHLDRDHVIVSKQLWDHRNRLVTRLDGMGKPTYYEYDGLDRVTKVTYADGTYETWQYNNDDELQSHRTQMNSIESWEYDRDGRPTSVAIDNNNTTGPVFGTTQKTWSYDGLSRVTESFNKSFPGFPQFDVRCLYIYDSVGRIIRETQSIGTLTPLDVDTYWSGSSRKITTVYPDEGGPRRSVSRARTILWIG